MPPGARDVGLCGRGRVVRRGARDQQAAERAARDGLPRGAVARVEAPLEADLDEDAGPLDLVDRRVERGEVERRRASRRRRAGRRAPPAGASARGCGVGVAITSASTPAASRSSGVAAAEGPARLPAGGRAPGVGVAHRHRRDAGQRLQRAHVEGPDAPGADDADAEGGRPRFPCSGLHR